MYVCSEQVGYQTEYSSEKSFPLRTHTDTHIHRCTY